MLRLLSLAALAATVVLCLMSVGLIPYDDTERFYGWAVWCCLKIPGFMESNEKWIEIAAIVKLLCAVFGMEWAGKWP